MLAPPAAARLAASRLSANRPARAANRESMVTNRPGPSRASRAGRRPSGIPRHQLVGPEREAEATDGERVEPGEGPREELGDVVGVSASRPTATDAAMRRWRAACSSRTARPAMEVRVGTSADCRPRATLATWPPLRTTTIMRAHGMPRTRWCSRSTRATEEISWAGLSARTVRIGGAPSDPAGDAPATAACCRPAPAVPIRAVMRDTRSRRAGSCRCAVGQEDRLDVVEPEPRAEPAEHVGAAAPERVRREIRVAEGDHGDPSADQGPQERHGGFRRLVRVVHQDEPETVDDGGRLAAVEGGHRVVDELGGVEMPPRETVDHTAVLVEQVADRRPFGSVAGCGERAQIDGRDPLLGRSHEHLAELRPEAAESADLRPEVLGQRGPVPSVSCPSSSSRTMMS